MSEAQSTPTVKKSETPDTLYAVFGEDPDIPNITTRDETAAFGLARERDWRVVTYQKE